MRRICRTCKVEYDGDPGSTLCPACVKAQKSTTIRTRVCRTCGVEFPGGPRAWYCPGCREQRKKAQAHDYHRRKVAGKSRPIGSEDLCEICGKPYTVNSSRQRYCPECAPAAWAEADRQQGRAWYAANGNPDARRDQRKQGAAELLCAVCGKPFKPDTAAITCSPACSEILRKRNGAAWEQAHRAERNAYQRSRYCRTSTVTGDDQIVSEVARHHREGASVSSIARRLGISDQKARRILITLGLYTNDRIRRIQQLREDGLTIDQIAEKLGCTRKTVISMSPYERGIYNGSNPTLNAAWLREWTHKKKQED